MRSAAGAVAQRRGDLAHASFDGFGLLPADFLDRGEEFAVAGLGGFFAFVAEGEVVVALAEGGLQGFLGATFHVPRVALCGVSLSGEL